MAGRLRVAILVAIGLPASHEPLFGQSLRPYSETCELLSQARREATSGRIGAAVRLIEPLADGRAPVSGCEEPPPPEAAVFEMARLFERAGHLHEAVGLYRRLESGVLSDEALYQEGHVLLRLGDVEAARAALGRVSRDSARFVEARVALADALAREGRAALAVAALRELLRRDLIARDVGRVRLALARALDASGEREAARDQALDAYLHADGDRAADVAARVLADLGHPVRRVERILRRVVRGEAASLKSLARPRARRGLRALDPGLADLAIGATHLKVRRDAGGAARALEQARHAARDPTVRACATAMLAEARVRADDDPGAVEAYRAIRSEFPGRLVAARAAVAEARALIRLRDLDAAGRLLGDLERSHPFSGLDLQVLWLQALVALMGSDRGHALAPLEEASRRLDAGDGVLFGLAERLRYFRGVALWEAGRREEGAGEFRRVARGFPHSYYGVLAVMRLREEGEDGTSSKVGGIADRARGPVILWRLGERTAALAEMKARAHRGLLHEADLKVLAAMLVEGRPERVAMSAQRYLRGWPGPGDHGLFEAAYPRPYAKVVSEVAGETGVDEAFLHAVMRAESGFNPSARSPAGAVGLMQMMPATARVVAGKLLGDARLARGLRNPKVNVRLGARFLAELQTHFRGHPPLVLAGYHAGAGAARRFHERLSALPTDVFVEAIPFSQTQAYLKRVIALAAGYRAFYGDPGNGPFEVPLRVPDSLGPFMEPPRKTPLARVGSTPFLRPAGGARR